MRQNVITRDVIARLSLGETMEQIFPVQGYTPPPQPPKIATIYFIGPFDGPIKIGYAKKLSLRLRNLRLASAFPLHVWATVEAEITLEREYHKRFAAHRLHGEWFERHPDILAEIDRLQNHRPAL